MTNDAAQIQPPSPRRPLVTLFESYAAGAATIGPAVAAELGVPWIGQQHSSDELESADTSGRGINLERFYRALRFADPASMGMGDELSKVEAQEQKRAVDELTHNGAVLLGRNGTVICADRPEALHVKLDAPLESRLNRAVETYQINRDIAVKRATREDRTRAEMSLMLWGWDPRANDRFDLVLNTSHFGQDRCVEIIVTLAREQLADAAS